MILSEQERQRALRSGLIGNNREHSELYLTSPLFRQKIDMLMTMLPEWVAGMAKEAVEQEQRINIETVKAQLMSIPMHIPKIPL